MDVREGYISKLEKGSLATSPLPVKCLRCGKCCEVHLFPQNITTGIRCPLLDENNLCTVYNDRPDWCLRAEDMMALNLLPDGCGYKEV